MSVDPKCFRNLDIRGTAPEFMKDESEMTELEKKSAHGARLGADDVEIIAKAVAAFLKPKTVVVGRDGRLNSPEFHKRLIKGLTESGVDVVDIGLVGVDVLYFALGYYGYDAGVEITASHCAKEINGLKIPKKHCYPLAMGSGMEELREIALKEEFDLPNKKGKVIEKDIWEDFLNYCFKFVDVKKIKPLKIVADAGNGAAGPAAKRVFKRLPCKIIPMYFEPDGNFPAHLPNPQVLESNQELIERIKKEKADLGISFDGDADRAFLFDENGTRIEFDLISAMVIKKILKKGEKVVYTINMSNVIRDKTAEMGGSVLKSRIGNAFVKQVMHDNDARLGCEASGHLFLKEAFYTESVFLPILHILELMSTTGKKLSELAEEINKGYYFSREINIETPNANKVLKMLSRKFKNEKQDWMDGLSVINPEWHFNIRASSNDPIMRLRVEAKTKEKMQEMRDRILGMVKG